MKTMTRANEVNALDWDYSIHHLRDFATPEQLDLARHLLNLDNLMGETIVPIGPDVHELVKMRDAAKAAAQAAPVPTPTVTAAGPKTIDSPRSIQTGRYAPLAPATVSKVWLPSGRIGYQVGRGRIYADRAAAVRFAENVARKLA